MGDLLRDLRYAFRVLSKRPGFSAVAILTLAIGVGANTTIFSIVNSIVFRPLPVVDPARVVEVFSEGQSQFIDQLPLSYTDYVDLRAQNEVFSGMVASTLEPAVLGRGDQTDLASGEFVSGNYFDVLGLKTRLGRTFHAEDEQPEAAPVAVISYTAWQRRFGSDPNVVGQTLNFSTIPVTIIGVADPAFAGLLKVVPPEFWVPVTKQEIIFGHDRERLQNRRNQRFTVMGRLKPGVTLAQARINMAALGHLLQEMYPETNKDRGITLLPVNNIAIHPAADRAIYASSAALLILSGFVLLIACANMANLLLARATGRRREIAVRLAVGASRARVIRQLLTESVVLALAGGAAGLLLALWCAELLNVIELPLPIQIALGVQLDWRVLAFTFAISLLTGILLGLAPALQGSKPDLITALKEEGGFLTGTRRRALLRSTLVVSQVATSLVLLIFAGLSMRSLMNAHSIDPGFNPRNLVVAVVDTGLRGYDENKGRNFSKELLSRLRALPGVESAGIATNLPLTFSIGLTRFTPEGEENLPQRQWATIDSTPVSPGYFQTMGIPMLAGRDLSELDGQDSPSVGIINETMARRYWPNQSPIGHHVNVQVGVTVKPLEIIGIVKNGKYRTLGEQPRPFLYTNILQSRIPGGTFIVRTGGDSRPIFSAIRATVKSMDENMPIFGMQPLEERMGIVLLLPKYAAILFGAFGILGALLAVVGLYGVISYSVSQRTHEIGIRVALGGRKAEILRLIVGEGMFLTGVGLFIGLLLAFAVSRFISTILYGIDSTDPLTYIAVSLLMIVVTLAACYIPAKRASEVEPIIALRYE